MEQTGLNAEQPAGAGVLLALTATVGGRTGPKEDEVETFGPQLKAVGEHNLFVRPPAPVELGRGIVADYHEDEEGGPKAAVVVGIWAVNQQVLSYLLVDLGGLC